VRQATLGFSIPHPETGKEVGISKKKKKKKCGRLTSGHNKEFYQEIGILALFNGHYYSCLHNPNGWHYYDSCRFNGQPQADFDQTLYNQFFSKCNPSDTILVLKRM
jgi:hypothetical protein